jgi:cytochrome P450
MSANPVYESQRASNLATKLLSLHQRVPMFTERHLTDMTLTHFGAGLETLGITIAAFLYNIIQQPGLQVKVQKELDEAQQREELEISSEGILKVGEMKSKLKLLEACLRETWRLNPVVGVPFPRVIGQEDLIVDGFRIPAGVSLNKAIPNCDEFLTQ